MNHIGERPVFVLCGIEELKPNRFQPRQSFNDEEQRELVASVKKSGIIQPIVVRKAENSYEIIVGERRWRAAQKAGLKEVPVIVRTADDRDLAELSLIENIQREALNPIEEADAYQLLATQFSLSHEEIALRVGKDRSTIANSVRLLKLPEAGKKALIAKEITAGHARAVLALEQADEQLAVLKTIRHRGLNVRETERLIKKLKKEQEPQALKRNDVYLLVDLEKELSSHLMTAVAIRAGKKAGSIEIRYSNGDELDRLVRMLLEAQ